PAFRRPDQRRAGHYAGAWPVALDPGRRIAQEQPERSFGTGGFSMSLRDASSALPSLAHRYRRLVETGEIRGDPAQERAIAALDRLIGEISSSRLAAKSSALGWLFARRQDRKKPVKGLYLYGSVGTGKTMLMDMFFDLVPSR